LQDHFDPRLTRLPISLHLVVDHLSCRPSTVCPTHVVLARHRPRRASIIRRRRRPLARLHVDTRLADAAANKRHIAGRHCRPAVPTFVSERPRSVHARWKCSGDDRALLIIAWLHNRYVGCREQCTAYRCRAALCRPIVGCSPNSQHNVVFLDVSKRNTAPIIGVGSRAPTTRSYFPVALVLFASYFASSLVLFLLIGRH